MLILFLLLFKVIRALEDEGCAHHVTLNRGEVKELLNPSYPLKDDPGTKCTYTIFAEKDRRIILACPFNEGVDKRTDKRHHCGAKINVWHTGEEPLEYCRDQTFAVVARAVTNNQMFISYNNDKDNPYNLATGFKCFLYAPMKELWNPINLRQKNVAAGASFDCYFFIELEHHDVIRLVAFGYDEENRLWRKCRWMVASPEGSKITVTCPFTARPPDPLLMQMEPCSGEFTVTTQTATKDYHCNDKAFSRSSTNNKIVLQYMSLMKLPSEDFECYVQSKSNEQDAGEDLIEPLPYKDCDHFIELNKNTTIKTPNYPQNAEPGSSCRWTVISPVSTRIGLHCDLRHFKKTDENNVQEKCTGEFTVTSLAKTESHCQDLGYYFFLYSRNNEMTLTYNNPSSNPATAVECSLTVEDGPPPTDCKSCDEYKSCDHVIKLNKREIKQLQSPHYPRRELPRMECRWTAVADPGRKIVFVCPFSNSLLPEVSQPSGGVITVTPEGGKTTRHSQKKGFFRIGGSNRMVITYLNKEKWKNLDAFMCYLYAELKERWDLPTNNAGVDENDFGGFDYNITLGRNSMTTLIPPSDQEDTNGWTKSRWNVSSPIGSRITIACHFTDKPPEPLSIQLVPCWGQFTVLTVEAVKTHNCGDRAFSYSTNSGWAVLSYENPQKILADNFACFAYSEDNLTSIVETEAFDNEDCDHAIVLAPQEYLTLKSEEYLTKKDEGHVSCRWMFIAPPNNRIRLDCHTPNALGPNEAEEKGLLCHGQLTVLIEGRNKTTHCSEKSIAAKTLNNRLVIIYENGYSQLIEHFVCRVSAEEKETWEIKNDEPVTSTLPYANCDQLHNMTYDEMVDVELPGKDKPGTACRWTIVAPRNAQILFSCPNNFVFYVKAQCNSFFIVSKGRRDEKRYCRKDNFKQLTTNYWTIVTYDNPTTDTNKAHFKCQAYVEKKLAADSCVNCGGHEALDYSRCDISMQLHEIREVQGIKNPNFPQDFAPGMPCRWTINSPQMTALFLECDLDASNDPNFNESLACRGMISVYTTEQGHDPTYHCRHSKFTAGTRFNKLVVTYGNQIGASTHPFKCHVTVEDGTCQHNIKLPHMQYNQYVKLSSPYWDSTIPPTCVWSIESEKNTQIYLLCSKYSEKRYDSLLVSNTGHGYLLDAKFKTLDKTFTEISVSNKMTILYNMSAETQSNTSSGCRIYVDKAPMLKHCNCGYKFNKLDPFWVDLDRSEPSQNRRVFSEITSEPDQYTFMAALVAYKRPYSLHCAATILSYKHAVSSAHCFCRLKLFLTPFKQLSLVTNEHDLPLARKAEFLIEVDRWDAPPCENEKELKIRQVALFTVVSRIRITNLVAPVCLPFNDKIRIMHKLPIIFLGWRNSSENFAPVYPGVYFRELLRPQNLMRIDGYIDHPSSCIADFRDFQSTNHYCITFPKVTNDCPGEIGGHIFWKDPETGLYKLIAIEDGKTGCGTPRFRAKAIKILTYLDWFHKRLFKRCPHGVFDFAFCCSLCQDLRC